jgi:hypothetical protein
MPVGAHALPDEQREILQYQCVRRFAVDGLTDEAVELRRARPDRLSGPDLSEQPAGQLRFAVGGIPTVVIGFGIQGQAHRRGVQSRGRLAGPSHQTFWVS